MFKNYLIVAQRMLLKNKLFSVINIGGLSLGLMAVVLISLFVADELSYDKHIPGYENIYRLQSHFTLPGRAPIHTSMGSGRAKFGFENEFSEVKALTRLMPTGGPVQTADKLYNERIVYADENATTFFGLNFIEGAANSALADNSSVALSEDAARKYFGDEPALGKTLTITLGSGRQDYRVAGVFENIPSASHLDMDMMVRLDDAYFAGSPNISGRWMATNMYVYLGIESAGAASALEASFPDFIHRNATPEIHEFGMPFDSATAIARWELIPIADIHLKGAPIQPMKPMGSVTNLIAFSVVAFLILTMAVINFVNLTAARATKRAKEMCVRKVVGATRRQLVFQILGETLLTVFVSLVFALTAAEVVLPAFNDVVGKELMIDFVSRGGALFIIVAATAGFSALAGLYPAWMLTSFQPSEVLHSQAAASSSGGRHRGILIVAQFAASIMLIIATIVVYRQTNFMQTIDAGYRTDGVLVVHGLQAGAATGSPETFKRRVESIADVKSTALSAWVPAQGFNGGTRATMEGLSEPVVLTMRQIDFDYLDTYGVNVLSGRLLNEQFAGDTIRTLESDVRNGNVVINARAAKEFGFASADTVPGQSFQMIADTSDPSKIITATVAGVIPDLIERSVREDVFPTVYFVDERSFSKLSVYYDTRDLPALMTALESTWAAFAPNTPSQIDFVDDRIANQYLGEAEASRIFALFSALAIIISSLGLYGLASFTTENRVKEIGVRKIFGASTWIIVRLLTLQISRPVLLANLIAWPVAWYYLSAWLSDFKFQIALTIIPFLIACVTTLVAAWLVVGSKAYKVAQAKPVNALRHS